VALGLATFELADTSDALETKLDNGDIIEGIRFHLKETMLGQGSIINDTGIIEWTTTRAMARLPCLGVRVNLGPKYIGPNSLNSKNCDTNLFKERTWWEIGCASIVLRLPPVMAYTHSQKPRRRASLAAWPRTLGATSWSRFRSRYPRSVLPGNGKHHTLSHDLVGVWPYVPIRSVLSFQVLPCLVSSSCEH